MKRNIVLVQGHPDPARIHLCHALGKAYADGAREADHRVKEIDIASLNFPILRNEADYSAAIPESLQPAFDAVLSADHVVIVFPLWLGTLPALTKAFFEQLFHRTIAFEDARGRTGFPTGLLTGRSARLVTTMSTPPLMYRYWYGAHGLKWFEQNALNLVGIRPVRKTLLGPSMSANEATRAKWVEMMRKLGHAGK
ncbi:putative NADPH-quinone reductase [Breoghania corrubedonensis]|uniref:Putative NADPH-quinone reductase n=1 Tax=Breoghania corrubedonensis TaxID=665038 RepID=A0A2T5V794_9HYPH|nr:NAD(P)H-dependent oxidoreductase [Breoghania corrubedonensis]PTW59629.1 putative NADPH-quinone reductase [Breoghania corrubedonensis]